MFRIFSIIVSMLVFFAINTKTYAEEFPYAQWLGAYKLLHPETKEMALRIQVFLEGEELVADYELLPGFCQKQNPSWASYCPFSGASGRFDEVEVSALGFGFIGSDPFMDDAAFSVNLMSLDSQTFTVTAVVAAAGRVSFQPTIEKN